MDHRAKKLDKKRKQRELAKKQARSLTARRPDAKELFVRAAARMPFGPCWINAEWEDAESPALVQAVVTRALADGRLLPGIVLVDRTCLGVKDGFVANPVLPQDVPKFIGRFLQAHRAMLRCEPLLIQSVVFHAIDYARKLGFEPHRDFPAPLFGPRPEQLLDTPWRALEKPRYLSGPRDNVTAIMDRLSQSAGDGKFDFMAQVGGPSFEFDLVNEEHEDEDGEELLLDSDLEQSVAPHS